MKQSEIVEVRMKLNIVKLLLQEQGDEDQWYGWKLRKKVKCHVKELYHGILRNRSSAWLKMTEAKLNKAKYGQRFVDEEIECTFVHQNKDQSLVKMMRALRKKRNLMSVSQSG